jgi:hypothetical protein
LQINHSFLFWWLTGYKRYAILFTTWLFIHDVVSQPTYSYAAAHFTELQKLVIMEYIFPGFTPSQLEGKVWWFPFQQLPDLPEALVDGKEIMYLS